MYRCLLVPYDGSREAGAALALAARIPAARALLLHVAESEPEPDAPRLGEAEMAEAAALLDAPGRTVDWSIVDGEPAEAIVAAAADADLIVMSTRGQGAGGRRIFGSVADRVARHAPAPTLLVRFGRAPVSDAPPKRVLAPLDGSAKAEQALPVAVTLARSLGAPIHLVTVVEPTAGAPRSPAGPVEDPATRRARQDAEERLAATAARLATEGVPSVTHATPVGEPAAAIIAAARPGDLVVMTPHGAGRSQRWAIGKVAERLLATAPVPVLLTPAEQSSAPARPA